MKISTLLDEIDLGRIALPEFQRGYVWNRNQVKGLMQSLYRDYPIGSLLVWVTGSADAATRGDQELTPGTVELLLDGQQRVTSLYGIIRGKPPKFFEGSASAFLDLYFHLDDEQFEFYAPVKMKGDAKWIATTDIMQKGAGKFMGAIFGLTDDDEQREVYLNRINAIAGIKDIDLHIHKITGADKTIDVVVDIFNRVNSGGTKLSKGDLALAKICGEWPNARSEMNRCLSQWEKAGFSFSLEWLLRNVNAIVTGEARFEKMAGVSTSAFKEGMGHAEKAVNYLLNTVGGRLGLDHDRVLGGRFAFPVMARYLVGRGGKLETAAERDKLLYWYVHAMAWGRFAGSTESQIDKDLEQIEGPSGSLDQLIETLRIWRGDLTVRAEDFRGWSLGARFYPLLYLLTRVHAARDFDSGLPLSGSLLGKGSRLHVHHIFPKARLYERGYARSQVNAIANFAFLTQDSNLQIGAKKPRDYLTEIEAKHPGALASQWIPDNPKLWELHRYEDFLDARRELLAATANAFLESLLSTPKTAKVEPVSVELHASAAAPGELLDDEGSLRDYVAFLRVNGGPSPELAYEIADPTTGVAIAIADLAWPEGVQQELTEPVALLLDAGRELEHAVQALGYRVFTELDELKTHIAPYLTALAAE